MKIKNILVPLDFSESSINALEFATEIANQHHASISLFHAFDWQKSFYEDEPLNFTRTLVKDLKIEHQEKMKELVDFGAYQCTAGFEYTAEHGDFITLITKLLLSNKHDLLVIGTRGAEDMKNFIIGSQTQKLIDNCEVPMLLIPQKANLVGFKKNVFATNYKLEDISSIKNLLEFSDLFQGNVSVVHVARRDTKEERKHFEDYSILLQKSIAKTGYKLDLIFKNNLVDALDEYVMKNEVGLVAISHQHRKGFVDSLLNPSLADDLALFARTPILLFNNK